jgi:hypothetical protein
MLFPAATKNAELLCHQVPIIVTYRALPAAHPTTSNKPALIAPIYYNNVTTLFKQIEVLPLSVLKIYLVDYVY